MRKVMLVIDEIQQLVGLETFMRRLGFDVLSLSKDALVPDALLGFQPEIVIASQQGRNVDGLKLSKRLKKTMVPPPRIAISYHGAPPVLSKDDQR
jgi:DNA-binding response OmpR family regulator